MVKKSNGIEDPKIDVFKQLQTFSKKSVSDVAKILENDQYFMKKLDDVFKSCYHHLRLSETDTLEEQLLLKNKNLIPELESVISKLSISFDEEHITGTIFGTNIPINAHKIKKLKIENIPEDCDPNIKKIIEERFCRKSDLFREVRVSDIKKSNIYQPASKIEIKKFLLAKIKKELYPFNVIFRSGYVPTTTKNLELFIDNNGDFCTTADYKAGKDYVKFGNLKIGLNALGTYSSKSNKVFFDFLCDNNDLNKKLLLEFYADKIIKTAIKKASEILILEDTFTMSDVRKGNAKLELISDNKIKDYLKSNYSFLGLKDIISGEKDPKQIERFAEIIAELLKGNA